MVEKEVMRVEDVSRVLGVTPNTIRSMRWRKSSKCPIIKRGKRLYVIAEDFWKWFKEGAQN